MKTMLLAAGGTGGHLFPAEALAHELQRRGWSIHLATDARAARYAEAFPAATTHIVEAATVGSKNPLALLKAGWTIWRGVRQATAILQQVKPQAVVGFGGYPTLPPVYAATRRGVPTLIHEQNAVMGRANRALAGRVEAIAGGFLAAEGKYADKTVVTGNPVRPGVIDAANVPYKPAENDAPFNLLVFGGSQGARFFSEALPQALRFVPDPMRRRLHITQQSRKDDEEALKSAYEDLRVRADITPFFDDMPKRIAESHLVISRSGASTVSELAAIGRPGILVPYPYALDHDQAANAKALEAAGGAEIHAQKDLTPERFGALIADLMGAPARLASMASGAKGAGRTNAAQLLADLAEAIASGKTVRSFMEGQSA